MYVTHHRATTLGRGPIQYVEIDLCQTLRLIRIITGQQRVTLLGHSLGGALSCAVAAVMPDYVDGVIHVCQVSNANCLAGHILLTCAIPPSPVLQFLDCGPVRFPSPEKAHLAAPASAGPLHPDQAVVPAASVGPAHARDRPAAAAHAVHHQLAAWYGPRRARRIQLCRH